MNLMWHFWKQRYKILIMSSLIKAREAQGQRGGACMHDARARWPCRRRLKHLDVRRAQRLNDIAGGPHSTRMICACNLPVRGRVCCGFKVRKVVETRPAFSCHGWTYVVTQLTDAQRSIDELLVCTGGRQACCRATKQQLVLLN